MKKNIIVFFVLICIVIGIVLVSLFWTKEDEIKNVDEIAEKEVLSLCYYYSNKTNSGFYDKAWLNLDIKGEEISGEFNNYPAEKDSKVGKFEGTVGPLDQKIMARTANLWWDSLAEGMNTKEELVVQFGDGNAVALFGEMIDKGDGVYVYKDKMKLTSGFQLGQISCKDLNEILAVEKYIRENIKTITTDKPVLGGLWYVVSVFINYSLNTGSVTYEDGHIQGDATFEYEFDSNTKSTFIKNFKRI
ncbi:hypothetical protein COX94_01370 [Candidatus Nomurabacteria bacterium CG_4_10_14_0_2_um_filter_33_9]|uniref:Uncharacterized protein n=1 Tax=Candidatus Nomurabacteria bacterium CG_4_10_14_0_2_um_filter_33_9 TaxID=1974728 RepID=A0A2J0ME50_9BACT|nr:MAG: hypothetical protein COX94_01370 [Candidatus Nomurabacteria bacterium CG_4_10_14_0_2_um_filter_33_9]